jgi:uncharacterized protein YukE
MSQIKADTDALRATIAAMRQGSSTIENALQQAAQAMTTLQSSRWSGNHRQQAEEIWTRLQAQFAPTIEALNQIAARTERFTNALEEAGRVFGMEQRTFLLLTPVHLTEPLHHQREPRPLHPHHRAQPRRRLRPTSRRY